VFNVDIDCESINIIIIIKEDQDWIVNQEKHLLEREQKIALSSESIRNFIAFEVDIILSHHCEVVPGFCF
jgi:hypothetical protein